jgi:hypothetical protein
MTTTKVREQRRVIASVDTSKPATRGRSKTGHHVVAETC